MFVLIPLIKGGAFLEAFSASPFSSNFTFTHIMPHVLGQFVIWLCLVLAYGNDYKGVWLFLVVPSTSVVPFARGVQAGLFFLPPAQNQWVRIGSCVLG